MLFEFTLEELLDMECPSRYLRCPLCGNEGSQDADVFTLVHGSHCALGKAIAIAKLKEEKETPPNAI